MTKAKTAKRALLMSVLSMLLCVSMLVGSTFAWFTDSVTSGNNKIVAGNLDVELLMKASDDVGYESITDESAPIFGAGSIAQNNNAETLWEPGKTQVAYLAIQNNGTLALKYKVGLDVKNVSKNLYEVMQYDITPDAQYGEVKSWAGNGKSVVPGTQLVSESDVFLGVGETHYFALSIHMEEEAGNEYMDGEVDFDLTVLATQATYESDSFGKDYDADSQYPTLPALINTTVEATIVSDGDTVLEDEVAGVTATIPEGALNDEVTSVKLTVKTEDRNTNSVTYEITLKDQNGKEVESTEPISVALPIGSGFKNVKVNHSGEPMDPADYSYSSATGVVTIKTKSFSPFEVTFEVKGSTWTGDVDTEGLAENTNTAEKTVTIDTPEQFAAFAQSVNSGNKYNGYKVKLASDIDLGNVAWTPIGDGKTTFWGTFDGQGKTIKNITVAESKKEAGNSNEYAGLFGKLAEGAIKNVTLENVTVTASLNAGNFTVIGAVVGQAFTGTVENVIVKNFNVTNAAAAKYVGGITGHGYAAIKNCYVQAAINPGVAAQVGGVMGMQAGNAVIEGCYADVNIDGGFTVAGGIIGFANSSEGKRNIKNCYVTGNIKGNAPFDPTKYGGDKGINVGGIAGYGWYTTATNCYCDATVTKNQMLLANCVGDYETDEMYSIVDCSWTGDFDSYGYYGYQNPENGYVYENVVRSENCTYSAGMSYAEFVAATPAN